MNSGCVQGVPSLAVSLDNVRGKSVEEYAAASIYTVALVKVGLAITPWSAGLLCLIRMTHNQRQ